MAGGHRTADGPLARDEFELGATLERCQLLKRLEVIALVNTSITNEGLSHLVTLPSLRTVLLHGTHVTPGFIERVCEERPSIQIDAETSPA